MPSLILPLSNLLSLFLYFRHDRRPRGSRSSQACKAICFDYLTLPHFASLCIFNLSSIITERDSATMYTSIEFSTVSGDSELTSSSAIRFIHTFDSDSKLISTAFVPFFVDDCSNWCYCWNRFWCCGNSYNFGDLESVLEFWDKYRFTANKRDCTESYNIVMALYAKKGMDSEAVKIFCRILDEGANPNCRTYTVMFEHLVNSGKSLAALEVFRLLPSMRIKRTLKQYSILIESFIYLKQFEPPSGSYTPSTLTQSSSPPPSSPSSSTTVATGAIVGIAFGVVAILTILIFVCVCGRRKKRRTSNAEYYVLPQEPKGERLNFSEI